jgi:hypothetical protein
MSYLSAEVRYKGEKIWAQSAGKEKRPTLVGYLYNGTYYQDYIAGYHVMQHGNSKGIDKSIYMNLAPRCHHWTIVDKKTGQSLSMPFKNIKVLLEYKRAIETDMGWGKQILVPLEYFSADGLGKLPAMQKELL